MSVFLAIVVSGIVGAVVTPLWYVAMQPVHARLVPTGGGHLTDFKAAPMSSKLIDASRGFVVAAVIVYLAHAAGVTTLGGSVILALVLWVGFPVILLIAPVIWAGESWKLAVLHSGDWFFKLLAMTVVAVALA